MKVQRVKGNTVSKRWRLLQAGRPVPLDAVSEVRMLVSLMPGQAAEGTTSLEGVCAVEDEDDGIVREPTGGLSTLDLALYRPAFRVTFGDGTTETFVGELVEIVDEPGP